MSGSRRRVVLIAAAGVVALGAAASWFALRDTTPLLTPEALENARSRWQTAAIADYDLTLRKELDARPTETVQTQARGGKATRLLINGAPVPPKDSYSVAGLFELLDTELELAGSKQVLPGQPSQALLKARFHPVLGIPLVVKRIAPNRQSYVIEVLQFATPDQLFL